MFDTCRYMWYCSSRASFMHELSDLHFDIDCWPSSSCEPSSLHDDPTYFVVEVTLYDLGGDAIRSVTHVTEVDHSGLENFINSSRNGVIYLQSFVSRTVER